MAVNKRLFSSGIPARMGPAAFTLASTVEEATGNWNHRVTAVYGTEAVPAPLGDVAQRYPIPPGGLPLGTSSKTSHGEFWPTWSAVANALPLHTVRPVGGGIPKPAYGGFVPAVGSLPQDLVITPQLRVRQGGRQARVTTNPKAQMRWVRQGG